MWVFKKCVNNKQRGDDECIIHHAETPPLTRLWFNILVCSTPREGDSLSAFGWALKGCGVEALAEKREKQSDWPLDGCFLSSFSLLYLLSSFSPYLLPEPPSLSPNSLTASIKEEEEEVVSGRNAICAHATSTDGNVKKTKTFTMYPFWTTTTSFNVWRGDDLLSGSLFFYGWRRRGVMQMEAALLLPLITQSNTKSQQDESRTASTVGMKTSHFKVSQKSS